MKSKDERKLMKFIIKKTINLILTLSVLTFSLYIKTATEDYPKLLFDARSI